jgi:hypothetical protein
MRKSDTMKWLERVFRDYHKAKERNRKNEYNRTTTKI